MTRERWDAEDILRDAVLYRMLLLGEIASEPSAVVEQHPEGRSLVAGSFLPGCFWLPFDAAGASAQALVHAACILIRLVRNPLALLMSLVLPMSRAWASRYIRRLPH